jgi:hypothetical protein
MAEVDCSYVGRYDKITHANEETGFNVCFKCRYLEEHLQAALSELNSLKLAIKLLYADSNMDQRGSEVRPHPTPTRDEVLLSTAWHVVQSEYNKTNNKVGRTEILQYMEPVPTSNRYDVLSNLSGQLASSDVLYIIKILDQYVAKLMNY